MFVRKHHVVLIVPRQSNYFVGTTTNNLRMKERFNVISFQRNDKISFRNIVKVLRKNQGRSECGRTMHSSAVFRAALFNSQRSYIFCHTHEKSYYCYFWCLSAERRKTMKMEIEELPMPDIGDEEKDIEIIKSIYNKRFEEVIR